METNQGIVGTVYKGQGHNMKGTVKHGNRLGESGVRLLSSLFLSLSEESRLFEGNL